MNDNIIKMLALGLLLLACDPLVNSPETQQVTKQALVQSKSFNNFVDAVVEYTVPYGVKLATLSEPEFEQHRQIANELYQTNK